MLPRKIALAVAITATLGAGAAQAAQVSYATFTGAGAVSNFTMLTGDGTYNGYAFGGTNNVTFTWDGTLFTSASDYTGPGGASNATIASPTAFFGNKWTAHTVQIFGQGTYSFDSAQGGGNGESGPVSMTVGAGQLGAHMLFNWGPNLNIDVVNVWNLNSVFSSCGASSNIGQAGENCLWTGPNNTVGNTASTVWLFASTDNNGDGTLGVPMAAGGPFADFNANFNLKGQMTVVPVPAAVWLFGSGLLGLVGIARRKKA